MHARARPFGRELGFPKPWKKRDYRDWTCRGTRSCCNIEFSRQRERFFRIEARSDMTTPSAIFFLTHRLIQRSISQLGDRPIVIKVFLRSSPYLLFLFGKINYEYNCFNTSGKQLNFNKRRMRYIFVYCLNCDENDLSNSKRNSSKNVSDKLI